MGIIAQAQKDIAQITGDLNAFGVQMTMTSPDGSQSATFTGLHTKHHLGVDTDGNKINSRTVSMAFSEGNLMGANGNYPLRDSNGEVNLKQHLVTAADSTGNTKKYMVQSFMPDETVGFIIVILEDYV